MFSARCRPVGKSAPALIFAVHGMPRTLAPVRDVVSQRDHRVHNFCWLARLATLRRLPAPTNSTPILELIVTRNGDVATFIVVSGAEAVQWAATSIIEIIGPSSQKPSLRYASIVGLNQGRSNYIGDCSMKGCRCAGFGRQDLVHSEQVGTPHPVL